MSGSVVYNWGRGGYRVLVLDESGEVAESYAAGNSPHDSQVWLDPDAPSALPLSVIRKAARRTALDMAKEHGLTARDVARDTDIDPA